MSKFDQKKVIPRFSFFAILMALVAVAVLVKAGHTMTAKKEYWMKVADRVKRDSVKVKPERGNILSCDGQLLASSLPEYDILVDFNAMHTSKSDTLWDEKEDSICEGLNLLFPERDIEEFRKIMRDAKDTLSTRCLLWPKRVNYTTYMAVKQLPIFRLPQYKGGFYGTKHDARVRPNGSLAVRTIGEMYGAKDSAKCGLELSYDSLLRGSIGLKSRRKVLNKYLDIIEEPAVNGADLITTIDVDMQDLAERALIKELKLPEVNGDMGVAIVMEVATGDIKAIVNMTKCADGEYREIINNAINYRCEPGSVFKPASIMVALDDEKCDTSFLINTGNGVMNIHNRQMKDHNWNRGGYGTINVARSLEVSSNIGVSYVINHFYGNKPEEFVDGLYRIGMHEDLKLPLVGYYPPRIPRPEYTSKGKWANWDATQLPWMSIGYGTMIAPINTLTFYNAIANNGKMVKPRFVTRAVKDGQTVAEFPVEVLKEQICKPTTLAKMQTMLEHVVSQGLGKKAGNKSFKVSGKTGTAQVSRGKAGYKSGEVGYWLSFAGYFPSDEPRYSCIVCIRKWGLPASGGGMSGVVFHDIAEGVMAKDVKRDISKAHDEQSEATPEVMRGNILAADYALNQLGFVSLTDWNNSFSTGAPIWGTGTKKEENTLSLAREEQTPVNTVPNVVGMGARDAVYLMEQRGLKVRLSGSGKVIRQSVEAGKSFNKGDQVSLTLSMGKLVAVKEEKEEKQDTTEQIIAKTE